MNKAAPISTPPMHASHASPVHAFTVDVEDWFHILESDATPDVEAWSGMESRVERSTTLLLDMLDRHGCKGTFFVLGWIAEKHPQLLVEIARRGHELGSHSHVHSLVSQLSPDAFARDLNQSLEAIHKASGETATCFRAPGFSIGHEQTWAFDILADHGITLDSSLFLADRAHGGFPLNRSRPFEIVLRDGRRVMEAPVVPLRLPRVSLPWTGGGYLRLLPQAALLQLFAHAERCERPVVTYVHPREVDPAQPRMALPPARRFKYYVGLDTVEAKLEAIFTRYRFTTLGEVANGGRKDPPLFLPLHRAA